MIYLIKYIAIKLKYNHKCVTPNDTGEKRLEATIEIKEDWKI